MRYFIACTVYRNKGEEEKRKSYRLLVGKSEGNGKLRRPRCRWVDNIKIGLRKMEWGGLDWFALSQLGTS
jgi:hypothetical protein